MFISYLGLTHLAFVCAKLNKIWKCASLPPENQHTFATESVPYARTDGRGRWKGSEPREETPQSPDSVPFHDTERAFHTVERTFHGMEFIFHVKERNFPLSSARGRDWQKSKLLGRQKCCNLREDAVTLQRQCAKRHKIQLTTNIKIYD